MNIMSITNLLSRSLENMPIFRIFTPLPSIMLLENIQKLAHNQDADKDLLNPSNKANNKSSKKNDNVIYTNHFPGKNNVSPKMTR